MKRRLQMKRRNMKNRIFAPIMVMGLLVGATPWIPADTVKATTVGEEIDNTAGTAENAETADDTAGTVDNAEAADAATDTVENAEVTDAATDAVENAETTDDTAGTVDNAETTDASENTEAVQDTESTENSDSDYGIAVTALPAETNARYDGITIDGDFSDWDAVTKYEINENKGWDTVDQIAMVWDGDMIYLYFLANGNGDGTGDWASVTGAGPNNNGQFAITTDLGKTLLVQLSRDNNGSVAGVDGASAAVNSTDWFGAPFMWEVSIPASALPAYKNTISFGMYLQEPVIRDVANLKGDDSGEDKSFNGVKIDGNYGDWEYYPHTTIQYATPGTHDHVVDAEGALYSADGIVYAHAATGMPAHLGEAGGEFTSAVTIRLNRKNNFEFYPQFVAVDSEGNINYNPQLSGLARGTYEFYLIDSQGWKTATNISQLATEEGRAQYHNAICGHMYLTVGASQDDMEFDLDLSLVAERITEKLSQQGKKVSISADDIRTVEAQWGRLGQQWVSTAGTSTGTWLGLIICFAAVGISAGVSKRRKRIAG